MSSSQSWGIVGGGVLGMTLSLRLAQSGHQVTLFEGADHLGGLASPWNLGDVVWDRHYHVTLQSDSSLRRLLSELGLEHEIEWVQTRTGFYTGGRLLSLSNTLEFLQFPPLAPWDRVRLGFTIFLASRIKDWQPLEQIPALDWLTRWSGPRATQKIWLPLLRAKLGENYTKVSAAFIWATIARMYAARRSGMKKERFGYVPGGYNRILSQLALKLGECGVVTRLNHRAKCAKSSSGRIVLEFYNGEDYAFDHAVLTVPASFAADICPELTPSEKNQLRDIEYQGIVCASLLLKKPLAGFYVTNITDSWVPFTAVIEMSALVNPKQFGGHALIYLPKYLSSSDPYFGNADDQIKEEFLTALVKMYTHFNPADVLSFQISRVRQVFALPTLDYSRKLPSMLTSIPGLYIVNSAHIINGTLNVNETIELAERTIPLLSSRTTAKEEVQHVNV
jgi:protoporphyrinogen oxidase